MQNNPFLGLNQLFSQYRQMQQEYDNIQMQPGPSGQSISFGDFISSQMGSEASGAVEQSILGKAGGGLEGLLGSDVLGGAMGKAGAISGLIGVGEATFGKAQFDDSVVAPTVQTDVQGQPIYNQKAFIDRNSDFRRDIKGTVGRGVGQGLLGGASAGMALGGPKGAAVGALVGGIGGLIGGSKRRRDLLRESTRREEESLKGIQMFNDRSMGFREDQEADDFRSALINRRNRY